jgi:type IV pilus assembly protein PilE
MRTGGFTLIELLVAMGIVTILTTMAVPSYRHAMHRAQRLDARLALQHIQYLQERHYAQHLRYATRLEGRDTPDSLPTDDQSEGGSYVLFLLVAEDGQSFTATARARTGGRQADDLSCHQLAIDDRGQRRSADAAGNWSGADPQRCWG